MGEEASEEELARQQAEWLAWSGRQAHILSGGGKLERCFVDYRPEELPHHHLQKGDWWQTFQRWAGSDLLVGAWCRPLCAGGWLESTWHDTDVFNLQTRTLFVDLRFPTARRRATRRWGERPGLGDEVSMSELRLLSRQHCFAGFSLVDQADARAPICTRHHCVDWNFHPDYPRPRPNKWRVELSDDAESFKEFGYAKDDFGQAVYMERWARLPGGGPRCRTLAAVRAQEGAPAAVLVVVGTHFALAVDRPQHPACPGALAGGCANLADAFFAGGDRAALSGLVATMEGSYGELPGWTVLHSTLPWREGQPLFPEPPELVVRHGQGHAGAEAEAEGDGGAPATPTALRFPASGEEWPVLESTFTASELRDLFRPAGRPAADPSRPGPAGSHPAAGRPATGRPAASL